MICFASYNRFHNTVLVDTIAVSLINAFSSLLVGIFSFATIGNIALEQNMSVEDVLTDGTYIEIEKIKSLRRTINVKVKKMYMSHYVAH